MKSSVKIIKRKQHEKHGQDEHSPQSETSEDEKSTDRSAREMASTIKSWIAELQQKKRAQQHSFSSLPVIVTAAGQNS